MDDPPPRRRRTPGLATRAPGLISGAPVLAGALGLLIAQGLTSATGYFYWLVAARTYPARIVGVAAALSSASLVVALLASQAVVSTLLVRMARAGQRRPLLRSAVAIGGGGSLLLAVVAVILLPLAVPGLDALRSVAVAAATVVVCVSQAVGLVADAAALAVGRPRVLVWRNGLFGTGKLVLAGALMASGTPGGVEVLLGSWAAAGSLSTLLALLELRRRTSGRGWALRHLGQGIGPQTVASVAGSVPPQLLPTIVTAQAGSAVAGYFSLTWLLGGLCFSISPAVSQAMLPTAGGDLRRSTRHAVAIIGAFLVVPIALFLLAGGPILGLFGPGYAAQGAALLALLAASAVPDAVTNVAVSRWRMTEQLRPAAYLNAIIATVSLGLVAGPLHAGIGRLDGIGLAWLAGQTAGCAFIVLHHAVVRRRSPRPPNASAHQEGGRR